MALKSLFWAILYIFCTFPLYMSTYCSSLWMGIFLSSAQLGHMNYRNATLKLLERTLHICLVNSFCILYAFASSSSLLLVICPIYVIIENPANILANIYLSSLYHSITSVVDDLLHLSSVFLMFSFSLLSAA